VLKCHVSDVLTGITVRTELSLRILERLKAENIEIPFPQRDLNIKLGDDGEVLAVLRESMADGAGERLKAHKPKPAQKAPAAGQTPSKPERQKRPSKAKADSMDADQGGGEGDR
jgi:potassium efflux system protein